MGKVKYCSLKASLTGSNPINTTPVLLEEQTFPFDRSLGNPDDVIILVHMIHIYIKLAHIQHELPNGFY